MRRGAVQLARQGAAWPADHRLRRLGRGRLIRKATAAACQRKIGDTEITAEQYRQAYQDEINAALATPRTAADARAGQDVRRRAARARRVWSARQPSTSTPRELNLALSDAGIAEHDPAPSPASRGPTASSPHVLFQSFLRQNGINEARYLRDRRREEIREQITDSLLAGVVPPQSVIEQLHQLSRGDARHRVSRARLRQADQACAAGRGQAAGVLRPEQAPVRDAGTAQDQRPAADA